MSRRLRYLAEYALLRAVVFPLERLPYAAAVRLATGVAWIGHRLVRYRADEARARLRGVFGSRFTEKEIRGIAWRSWRNFIWSAVDMVRLRTLTPDWCRRHVVNLDEFQAQARAWLPSGRGAVIATPHMGSTEVGGVLLQQMGLPMFFFEGRQKNPLVNAYLNQLRGSTGTENVKKGSPDLRQIVRRLRKGEILGIMPDLRYRLPGVEVSFLGGSANVPPGIALFALMAGCPIVVGVANRTGPIQHRMRLYDPIMADPSLDKEANIRQMTQRALDIVDREIREQPDQWFWYNKRWILDPLEPGEPAAQPQDSSIAR